MRESLYREIQDGCFVDEYKDLARRIHEFQEETEKDTRFTVTALRHIADRMEKSMGLETETRGKKKAPPTRGPER
jgi:hypothetical protein